jgi:hypothetical protein
VPSTDNTEQLCEITIHQEAFELVISPFERPKTTEELALLVGSAYPAELKYARVKKCIF